MRLKSGSWLTHKCRIMRLGGRGGAGIYIHWIFRKVKIEKRRSMLKNNAIINFFKFSLFIMLLLWWITIDSNRLKVQFYMNFMPPPPGKNPGRTSVHNSPYFHANTISKSHDLFSQIMLQWNSHGWVITTKWHCASLGQWSFMFNVSARVLFFSFSIRRLRFLEQCSATGVPSRGWVNPSPDPLLLRKSVAPGIEPGTSGSVTRNSDH
jgi:hypothetical protein